MVPLGELILQGREWTGLDAGALIALLEGASPISAGHTAELDALAAALRSDAEARGLLASNGEPAQVLGLLRALPGQTGEAARGFLDLHGFACVGGHEPVETYALERPEAVLASIRAAVDAVPPSDAAGRVREAAAAARLLVPVEHREAFDTLLADARYCYRIKDERGMYNDMPARGLVRRAILEGGRRLQAAGRLAAAEHLLEASPTELQELLTAGTGPAADELRDRYEYRLGNSDASPPTTLGEPDGSAVPPAWLPSALRRMQRAMIAGAQAMESMAPSEEPSTRALLRGLAASRGTYEGPARIVRGPTDFTRIEQGDVLVTLATTPAISAWLPLLGAIVTDHGGPLSHAAIVAREYGLPAVVGARSATSTFSDGQTLYVDGDAGTVEVRG